MQLHIIETNLFLALLMFYSINWLGKHSINIGYMSLSAFLRSDDAPAFNFLFRVLAPVIFVVLLASILYSLGLDSFVENIWLTTLFCCAIRFSHILIFGRFHLVNWPKEFSTWILATGLTWATYKYFIETKSNLLPEAAELRNQFWIIIILYIYSILNQLELDNNHTKGRKLKYLQTNYNYFKHKFGSIISNNSPNILCESLIYAVLLHENFNRPKLIRGLEHLVFPWLSKTIGPMQVTTNKRLSDAESIDYGSKIIANAYIEAVTYAVQNLKADIEFNPYIKSFHMRFLQYRIAAKYNRDDEYVSAVCEMHDQLLKYFYPTFITKEPTNSISDYYLHMEY